MIDLFTSVGEAHDAGGKVMLPLPPGVCGSALFGGENDQYRYRLCRTWNPDGESVCVIMMNPSTANPMFDDPTIAKITRMARHWNGGIFGRLIVGNIFAYRATDQTALAAVNDPVGPQNDAYLRDMARTASLTVFAYGYPKIAKLRQRGPEVVQMLFYRGISPHVLRMGKHAPVHPLYLPDLTYPVTWPGLVLTK